jgi:hypothetical protein
MRDVCDRTIGIIDESGAVISCSDLGRIGEVCSFSLEEYLVRNEIFTVDSQTYKPFGSALHPEYVVFVDCNDELSKKYAINDKKGLFGRKGDISSTVKIIEGAVHSCSVCNKINKQMNNAIENLVYLLNTEKDFEESFFNIGELCAEHFSLVLSACEKELGSSHGGSLAKKLCDMQTEFLNELKNNLHDFTISFDYRSKNQELSEKAKSSVADAVKYIGKY